MVNWTTPTLFLSDLHLGRGDQDHKVLNRLLDAAGLGTSLLLQPLEQQHSQPFSPPPLKRIVLLGDLFDFNLGYQTTLFRAHLPLYLCLMKLIEAGVEIWVFTGNHDPDISPVLKDDLKVKVSTGPFSLSIFGEPVLLEHGDLLEPSWFKRTLCYLVRTPLVRALAKLCPPNLAWRLLQSKEYKQPVISDTRTTITQQVIPLHAHRVAGDFRYWIFGHFHQALAHTHTSKHAPSLSIFSLGDQVSLHTTLFWDEHGPQLCRFLSSSD